MEMRRTHDRYPKEPSKPANVPDAANSSGRMPGSRMSPGGAVNMPAAPPNMRYPSNRPMHSPISAPPNINNADNRAMPNRPMPNQQMPNRQMPNRQMPNLMAAAPNPGSMRGRMPGNQPAQSPAASQPNANSAGRRYPSNNVMSNPMTAPVNTGHMGSANRMQSPMASPAAQNANWPMQPANTPAAQNAYRSIQNQAPVSNTGGMGSRQFNNRSIQGPANMHVQPNAGRQSPAATPNTGRMDSRYPNSAATPKTAPKPAETNNRPRFQ